MYIFVFIGQVWSLWCVYSCHHTSRSVITLHIQSLHFKISHYTSHSVITPQDQPSHFKHNNNHTPTSIKQTTHSEATPLQLNLLHVCTSHGNTNTYSQEETWQACRPSPNPSPPSCKGTTNETHSSRTITLLHRTLNLVSPFVFFLILITTE